MSVELFIPSSPQLGRTDFIEGYKNSGVATLETYVYFEGTKAEREAQKAAFLTGQIENPILSECPRLEDDRVGRRRKFDTVSSLASIFELVRRGAVDANAVSDRSLLERLLNPGLDQEVATRKNVRDQAIADLLERRGQEIAYLEAAWHASTLSADHRAEYAGAVSELGRELFGQPNYAEFIGLNESLRAKAAEVISDDASPALRQIALEFLQLSSPAEVDEVIGLQEYVPNPEVVAWYGQKIREQFDPVFDTIFADVDDEDKTFEPEEMAVYFNRALEALGYAEWTAEINPNGTAVEARQTDQKLLVGAGREAADLDTMRRLVIHEIGVHIGRRSTGDSLDDGLLGVGLAGYGGFEEGFAVALEEAYAGKVTHRGTQYTFALGMAMGMDGGGERDFRGTFELQWRRNALQKAKKGELTEQAIAAAKNTAYNQCVRIWRGMPTDVPGCVYPKDMAYSNVEVWQYLETQYGVDDILPYLLSGKFSPLIPQHNEVVASYAA